MTETRWPRTGKQCEAFCDHGAALSCVFL